MLNITTFQLYKQFKQCQIVQINQDQLITLQDTKILDDAAIYPIHCRHTLFR